MSTNRRYISRRRSVSQVAELTAGQEFALAVGPNHAQMFADCDPDVEAFWREAWLVHRDRLLERWIAKYPGTRPWGFWTYDWPSMQVEEDDQEDDDTDDQEDDDEELDDQAGRLHRAGLIGAAELAAIVARARALAQHNEGRRPGEPGSNWLPPDSPDELAVKLGLLTAAEAANLTDSRTVSITERINACF
jgi:hypothetical protein